MSELLIFLIIGSGLGFIIKMVLILFLFKLKKEGFKKC